MNQKSVAIFLIIFSLLLISCGLTNRFLPGTNNAMVNEEEIGAQTFISEDETEEEQATITPESNNNEDLTVSSVNVDACYHPFLPVIDGATWTYSEIMESDYTLTMKVVDENTFIMDQEMHDDGTIFSVEWFCSVDGLLQGTFADVDLFGDSSDFEGMDLSFKTLNWEGQTLPDPDMIEVGYSWTASYTLSSEMGFEGFTSEMFIEVTIEYVIAAIEEITVPAGTFPKAYRVDSASAMEMIMGETTTPINVVTYSFSSWYVEDVGLIKIDSDFLGFSSEVELLDSSLLN